MRSSAPEGQHAPRAKQVPPSGSSGATAGPAGAPPPSPHSNSSSSPRPQPSLIHAKGSPQSLRAVPPSQNRVAAQSRPVTNHPQLQRSQPRSSSTVTQSQLPQQRSPPISTPSSGATKQPLTTQLPKVIQPSRLSQQPQKTSPQALTKPHSQGPTSKPLPQASNPPPNFGEYDDQEWDVGVGHLIIDLDADIAQADRGRMSSVPGGGGAQGTPIAEDKHSLKMKIKRTKPPTKTSEAKHEIVKPDSMPNTGVITGQSNVHSSPQHNGAPVKSENNCNSPRGTPTGPPSRNMYKKEKRRLDVNGTAPSPPPAHNAGLTSRNHTPHSSSTPPSSSTPSAPVASGTHHSIPIKSEPSSGAPHVASNSASRISQGSLQPHQLQNQQSSQPSLQQQQTTQQSVPPVHAQQQQQQQQQKHHHQPPQQQHQQAPTPNERSSPTNKRQKLNEEITKRDACVGTSVATITEPDCLGPCEPGSSVTLEGIVWHETEGGVLVVNVTWRGKTYVGTLLDCTKHDWAPPRFCDSPTSDLESRTPKGRAKRGRAAASFSNATSVAHTPTTELSVTETRSGKLRHASLKGRRGGATPTFNPPSSPVKVEVGGVKRKGRETENTPVPDPKMAKRSRSSSRGTPTNGCSSPSIEQQQQHCNNSDPQHPLQHPPPSPQLIECPEPNCNKKYKHINGLKYHQSHAHTNSNSLNDDDGSTNESRGENSEVEESRPPSPTPVVSTPADASSQDLIKPAVLRPTPATPTHATNGENNGSPIPSQPIILTQQTNGTHLQVSNSPQHLYVYPTNLGSNSPQKQSGIGGLATNIIPMRQAQVQVMQQGNQTIMQNSSLSSQQPTQGIPKSHQLNHEQQQQIPVSSQQETSTPQQHSVLQIAQSQIHNAPHSSTMPQHSSQQKIHSSQQQQLPTHHPPPQQQLSSQPPQHNSQSPHHHPSHQHISQPSHQNSSQSQHPLQPQQQQQQQHQHPSQSQLHPSHSQQQQLPQQSQQQQHSSQSQQQQHSSQSQQQQHSSQSQQQQHSSQSQQQQHSSQSQQQQHSSQSQQQHSSQSQQQQQHSSQTQQQHSSQSQQHSSQSQPQQHLPQSLQQQHPSQPQQPQHPSQPQQHPSHAQQQKQQPSQPQQHSPHPQQHPLQSQQQQHPSQPQQQQHPSQPQQHPSQAQQHQSQPKQQHPSQPQQQHPSQTQQPHSLQSQSQQLAPQLGLTSQQQHPAQSQQHSSHQQHQSQQPHHPLQKQHNVPQKSLLHQSQIPPPQQHAIQVSSHQHLIQQSPQQQLSQSKLSQPPPIQHSATQSLNQQHSVVYHPQIHEQSVTHAIAAQQINSQSTRLEIKPELLGNLTPGHGIPTSRPSSLNILSDGESQSLTSTTVTTVASIPQGTPLSSLPGSTLTSLKGKSLLEGDKLLVKPKDLVNGMLPKREEEQNSREDTRSPAYSDISDANEAAPVIDGDVDSKDFKDDKKADLPIGGATPYTYGLYFGAYGQPPHPYLMPSIQPPPGLSLKPGEIKDLKDKQLDKDKKEGLLIPGGNDYMKFPPQYLYSYSHLYPPGYPDPYLREPMYKEIIEKPKLDLKDCPILEENDKGPTDLSRSSSNSNPMSTISEKALLNLKEKPENHIQLKEVLDARGQLPNDKRPIDPSLAYRYIGAYDARMPVVGAPLEKSLDSKISMNANKPCTPVPLTSPRSVVSTPPGNKEDKSEKRPDTKSDGIKPTMETTGPPPPPNSAAYYPPFPYAHVPFDPYPPSIVPGMSLGAAGFPPSYLTGHSPGLGGLRYPLGVPSAPEDLSRNAAGGSILPPPGLYTGSHKIAELQERAQKSPSSIVVSSAGISIGGRGGSPLTMMSKDPMSCVPVPHSLSPIVSSPSFSNCPTIFTSSFGGQQLSLVSSGMGPLGDGKSPSGGPRLPPHTSLPEGYPYSLLPAQFSPHFTALGVTPTAIPSVGVGGPVVPPSGMGGAAPPPK